MKTLYLDCFAGISGDMTLAALLDAGASLETLRLGIAKLKLHPAPEISLAPVTKKGIGALKVDVSVESHNHHHSHHHDHHHEHCHRGLHEIEQLICSADLSEFVKTTSLRIFRRLAEAEATVHRSTIDAVHFHEVGAVDAIVDIVGTALCLESLGIDNVIASAIPTFSGTVHCAHGELPLPAPATLALLQGVPWRECGIEKELVTPTGAAILTTLATSFGSMPALRLERVGYGSGSHDLPIPNLLRAFVGVLERDSTHKTDVVVIETNIDDMNPQHFERVFEVLFERGALDAYVQPVQMKKTRPGFLLTVLCEEDALETIADTIFHETTTIGFRITRAQRRCLDRVVTTVATPYGEIRVKIAKWKGEACNIHPEYEDCLATARRLSLPLKTIHDAVLASLPVPLCPRKIEEG